MAEFLLICAVVGAAAGVLAGLLGVGGGLVIVPTLAWAFAAQGFDGRVIMHLAVGTSLATIILTSLSSIRAHHRRGAVLWPVVLRISPGILIGALVGAAIADLMPTATLRTVFAIFVFTVAWQLGFGVQAHPHRKLPGNAGMSAAGGVIGAVSAIVGIGGGSMTVPFLVWCNTAVRQAVATSAAVGFPIAISGTAGFVLAGWNSPALPEGALGYVHGPAWIMVAAVSVLTAPLGAKLAHTIPTGTLKRFFAFFLFLIGVRMLLA